MPKLGIEFDEEAQKQLEVPLGERELYPTTGKYVAEILREQGVTIAWGVYSAVLLVAGLIKDYHRLRTVSIITLLRWYL